MKFSDYKPLKGEVLLRPITIDLNDEKYQFMATEDLPQQHAEVVSIGEGVEQVKLQQVVIYPEFGLDTVYLHGDTLLVGKEELIRLITPHKVELVETKQES